MIQDFSGGYYQTEMTVQPMDSGPAIERGLYDFINREFYYQTDAPITMRVGMNSGTHFRPAAEGAMPTDVLGLPVDVCDSIGVHPSAESVNVYILKPAHAYLFGQTERYGESFEESANISTDELKEETKEFFDING
jgi:hypothetical protein